MTRKFGFNMCRKHVKVEPDRWYYWADKLGLLVWQDMPSCMASGKKHGIPSGAERDVEFSSAEKTTYRVEWQAIMDALYNHPSIVVFVPFNEGWGSTTPMRCSPGLGSTIQRVWSTAQWLGGPRIR